MHDTQQQVCVCILLFSSPQNTILVARVMHVYTNMFVNIYANNIIPFIFSSKRTILVARIMHVYTNMFVNIYANNIIPYIFSSKRTIFVARVYEYICKYIY